ncbi:MAG: hypothetical protein JW808_02970 [Victivallales bacterium]|nr:hypothetical protein [Victivallales bacterium]
MRNRVKLHYKRRLIIYPSLFFFIVFCILDFYLETRGLPEGLAGPIRVKLRELGLEIDFDKARIGVVHGINLCNPVLRSGETENFFFRAERLKLGFSLAPSRSYLARISSLEVKDGSTRFMLFPEAGEEGMNDRISIENFSATVYIKEDEVSIKYLHGTLDPFDFSAAGTFKNITVPDFIPAGGRSQKGLSSRLNPSSVLKKIPYLTRARIYREIIGLRQEGFSPSGRPACHLVFNLDASSPDSSTIKANLSIPALSFGDFKITSIKGLVSLNQYIMRLDNLSMAFPDGGRAEITASLDLFKNEITGKLGVHMLPGEFARLAQYRDLMQIPEFIQIHNKPFSMESSLKNFSLDSKQFTGDLSVCIPSLSVKGIPMRDFKADISVSDKVFITDSLSFRMDNNTIEGSLRYHFDNKTLEASVLCKGSPIVFTGILPKDLIETVEEFSGSISLPSDPSDIEIRADVFAQLGTPKPFIFASGVAAINKFAFREINFTSGIARFYLDSESLFIVPAMTLHKTDSMATFALVYDNTSDYTNDVSSDYFGDSSKGRQNDRLFAEFNGNLPGDEMLKCIFSFYESGTLVMDKPVRVEASGMVDFMNMPDTIYRVKIIDSPAEWSGLPVENFSADLFFKGFDMFIKDGHGKLYDGDMRLDFLMNLETWLGKLELDIDNSSFAKLAKFVGEDMGNQEKGLFSLSMRNDFSIEETDESIERTFITGDGKVWIREADLWDIPIINQFGELTAKFTGRDWGNITTLDADLDFRRDHLFSDNIRADGTVISLSAKGVYFWENGNFDFTVRASVLESTLPLRLSKIFDPLSWMLESRVQRVNNQTKWEKIHKVKRLLRLDLIESER